MNTMNSEEIALKFVDRINTQDADGGNVYQGRERMRNGFAEYFSAYPKYKIQVEKICLSGNDIAFIAKTTGSHVPSELEEKETLIFIAQIENGLVAEWRIYTDLEKSKR
ncbi:MAG: nuclear transport factor 2 family protein [bacterium]